MHFGGLALFHGRFVRRGRAEMRRIDAAGTGDFIGVRFASARFLLPRFLPTAGYTTRAVYANAYSAQHSHAKFLR